MGNQNLSFVSEDLGVNADESRPDQHARDMMVGQIDYRKGRGYYLNVFVQTETKVDDGVAFVTRSFEIGRRAPTDLRSMVQEAGRFNAKTLEKLAAAEKGSERSRRMMDQVRVAHAENAALLVAQAKTRAEQALAREKSTG